VLAVAGLFPHGEAVTVENCGHFPWVEQPAAWRAAVDPFLARAVS
jgi:pimeloyl-ACP methyl ester carboxylesterase